MTTEENKELSNSDVTPVNEISAVDAVNVVPEQTAVPVQNEVYSPQPVDNSQQSSVVVSGGGNGKTPVWFYALFLIVLAVFIMMAYLLYQSLPAQTGFGRSKQMPQANLPEKTAATPSVPTPTAVPTIFREEVDAELIKLTQLNPGDEIADLESDTGKTNLNSLEDWLKDLDNKFNFTSQP